jgi:hypothetical protein
LLLPGDIMLALTTQRSAGYASVAGQVCCHNSGILQLQHSPLDTGSDDRKDFAMNDWKNLPKVDPTMLRHYEMEAHRLRAEAMRETVHALVGLVRRLFSAAHLTAGHAAQPSK